MTNDKMKNERLTIVHFSQDFARGKSQLGGFGRVLNICSDNHDHIIFTVSARISMIEEYNIGSIKVIEIPIEKMPISKKRQFFVFKKIALTIMDYLRKNKIKPDLLFGHSQILNFFVLKQIKKMFSAKLKLLWEANAIWGIHQSGGIKVKINNRLNRFLQRIIFRVSDGIICQTNSSKDFIIEHFHVSKDKISVIKNAVLFDQPKAPASIRNFPKRILCFGLFDEMNGIPFLVDFIRSNNAAAVEYNFIGNGLYKQLIVELAGDGLCKYLGTFPHSEMQVKLREFDFVIIPRLSCIEADLFIPTKLIESMYAGVIPICSDVKGMAEVIVDGENGFLFNAGNQANLNAVLSRISELGYDELHKIACKAHETALTGYNWKNNHLMLNLIYRELLPYDHNANKLRVN